VTHFYIIIIIIIIIIIDKNLLAWFEYKLCESYIIRTETIKDMGCAFLSSHGPHIFRQSSCWIYCLLQLFPFPPLEKVLMLYCTLVTLEYASVAWNSVTRADASNLECFQWKFLSLCLCRFPNHLQYNYVKVSNFLNSHTLSVTSSHLAAPFLIKLIVCDG
jgi:hypothetical protein